MDDGGVHACGIHLLQQLVLGVDGDLSVRRICRWTTPPDMHLRVNN
jgi:hypothetical protein